MSIANPSARRMPGPPSAAAETPALPMAPAPLANCTTPTPTYDRPPRAFRLAGRSPFRTNPMTFWSPLTVGRPRAYTAPIHDELTVWRHGQAAQDVPAQDAGRAVEPDTSPLSIGPNPRTLMWHIFDTSYLNDANRPRSTSHLDPALVGDTAADTHRPRHEPLPDERPSTDRRHKPDHNTAQRTLRSLVDFRRRARDAAASDAREARRVAGWLRAAVARVAASGCLVRRSGLLLGDRVVAVQAELLEIAELLERSDRPDAQAVTAVRRLLTDGLQSPLYNRDVHPSELLATLYFARLRLADDAVWRRLDTHNLRES